MDLKKLSIKKILRSLKGHHSVEKKALYSPHRDWIITLSIFFVLLICTIVGHFLLYAFVEKGVLFNETAEEEIFRATLRKDAIEEVVSLYEQKNSTIENFNEVRGALVDPS